MNADKIALIHDWLINVGGSEKVLSELYKILKEPNIYTIFAKKETIKLLNINFEKVKPLIKFKKLANFYKWMLPLYPFLVEEIDLSEYKVIISSSHSVAKGVITTSTQIHICYCHTPPRYIWDMYFLYKRNLPPILKFLFSIVSHYYRMWDYISSQRIDYFIANSKYVAGRIKKFYRRDSVVIYPPVDVKKFKVIPIKEDFYITASRLVRYKNVDLIIEAFNLMKDKKLIVIGAGEESRKLKKKAGQNIEFLGHVDDEELAYYLARAKAYIYAADEDFGILPVEAQASGTPVIAYGKGGILETVIKNKTGVFFYEKSPYSLVEAIKFFEKNEEKFDPMIIRSHAENFSVEKFREKFIKFLGDVLEKRV